MASSHRVERFFDELGQRGHEPLLTRFAGTGRFEVLDDGPGRGSDKGLSRALKRTG